MMRKKKSVMNYLFFAFCLCKRCTQQERSRTSERENVYSSVDMLHRWSTRHHRVKTSLSLIVCLTSANIWKCFLGDEENQFLEPMSRQGLMVGRLVDCRRLSNFGRISGIEGRRKLLDLLNDLLLIAIFLSLPSSTEKKGRMSTVSKMSSSDPR